MVLDGEENACGGMRFNDVCFVEECLCCAERRNLVDFDDSESDDGWEDIVNLLPNDPFEMECNLCLPDDPSGMDFNISLPRDPFNMDFNIEATVAVIAGWMEDYGLKPHGFENDEASEDNKFFAELNFVWTSSLKYEQEEGENVSVDASSVMHTDDGSYDGRSLFLGDDMEELICFGCEKYQCEPLKDSNDGDGGVPADALFLVLGYLGVWDLLSVEMVCKSLRDAVQNDPLLWRSINIDYPLSSKITNDILLWLTNRAQGTLSSLSLVKCSKITNVGLKHVLRSNPGLTKLSVPGCIKISVEEVLHDLKAFNSSTLPGIKLLRIGELFGLTNQHFNEFKLLLGADEDKKKSSNYKPRYYRAGQLYLPLDDERAIDIETCPMCQQARQVYDCTAESCQVKVHSTKACRACIFCVARCSQCGCCLTNKAFIETFSLELLCADCWFESWNCEGSAELSTRHTYFHQDVGGIIAVFMCPKYEQTVEH